MRTGGDITRKRLLIDALHLFTKRPYDKVTLRDIESVSGLSRGALMYHFPNKEALFKEAVQMFVFRNNTLTALPPEDKLSLRVTIDKFIKMMVEEQRVWRKEGIKNINFALFTVENSYFNLSKESLKATGEWYDKECEVWREVIEASIASGEINEVDAEQLAHLLEDCYLGAAYAGMTRPTGYSPKSVEAEMMLVYNLVKK